MWNSYFNLNAKIMASTRDTVMDNKLNSFAQICGKLSNANIILQSYLLFLRFRVSLSSHAHSIK